MRVAVFPLAIALSVACDEPSVPLPVRPAADERPERAEPLHLEVPPRLIARARREAAGLYRMPPALRRQILERRRAERGPSYQELRDDPTAHAHAGASFEGRVGFVRSAGPRLWIMPFHTRRVGDRWVDPIYVLSTIPPQLPIDGGALARIDGFVAGERTIGRNTLPLIVGYYVERLDAPASDEGDGEGTAGE